jgi:tRNA (mo5U34)-methyltransferase
MNISQLQSRIDAVDWYHEFDFGPGLNVRSKMPDVETHRRSWRFIERHLNTIDFKDKSVLDIGCWDGYWSFYAERHGAREVLATDDRTQNWSDGNGVLLARELLGSRIEVNQDMSAYSLASLNRKFDIILFLGVHYHLLDPFYALAQIRQCCHRDTVVLIHGAEAANLSPATALYDLSNHSCEWTPTREALTQLLGAAYFEVIAVDSDPPGDGPLGVPGRRWRLRLIWQGLKASHAGVRRLVRQFEPGTRQMFMKCIPFEGENKAHYYRPPFELHRYDSRFRS